MKKHIPGGAHSRQVKPKGPRPDNKDVLDSRKKEEQDFKGDDVTHNKKETGSRSSTKAFQGITSSFYGKPSFLMPSWQLLNDWLDFFFGLLTSFAGRAPLRMRKKQVLFLAS